MKLPRILISTILAIFCVSALPILGCGPAKKHYPYSDCDTYFTGNGERLSIFQFSVLFPASLGANSQESGVNEQQKLFLYEAIRSHILAFQKNEGVVSISAAIAVTDVSDISGPQPLNIPNPTPSPSNPNTDKMHIIGRYCSPNKVVVWTGGDGVDTVPALYHELCHLNFAPGDADHLDPRWPLWNKRGGEVVQDILSTRGK